MAAVMIGVDPHKASHTATAIGLAEEPLGQVRIRASESQVELLVAWAAAWPDRTWAVEGATGLGNLLAQQLVAAGERVLDVQPKLAARVRLLEAGNTNKNDPNDARSVAVAALRSAARREVIAEDHAAVLKVWSKRYRDLGRARTQVACRFHAVLADLVPGGFAGEITAGQAAGLLARITPSDPAALARHQNVTDQRVNGAARKHDDIEAGVVRLQHRRHGWAGNLHRTADKRRRVVAGALREDELDVDPAFFEEAGLLGEVGGAEPRHCRIEHLEFGFGACWFDRAQRGRQCGNQKAEQASHPDFSLAYRICVPTIVAARPHGP